ncbi:SpoIIAA-like, partial [Fulvimarina manganoxydans]
QTAGGDQTRAKHEHQASRLSPESCLKSLPRYRQDMKIDAKRSDDLSRVAMVADQAWIKWGASAADLATGAKLKWFDTSERDAAIAWARDG